MATKYLRGGAVKTTYKATAVTLETNTQITLTANLEDVSTKDDAEGWDKQAVIKRSWSVQSDKLVEDAGTTAGNLLKLWVDQTEGAALQVAVGTGDPFIGSAIITQVDIDATVQQNVTCSATYTGVGAFNSTPPRS